MAGTRKIERLLRREYPTFKLSYTGSGHIRLRLPNGAQVIVSATPSDGRFIKNVRTTVRRALSQSR